MVFQHPEYLWAWILCGVPWGIWCLVRRRARRVDWAAMRFLQEAIQETRAKNQRRELFLVGLETAAVLFLVGALAGPGAVRSNLSVADGETVLLVLDDSGSMNAQGPADATRWETARQILRRHFAEVPNTQTLLLSGGELTHFPTRGTLDDSAMRTRIAEQVRALPKPVHLFLFTDGLWKMEGASAFLESLEATTTVVSLYSRPENLSVTSLLPAYAPVLSGGAVALRATVENCGEVSRHGVPAAWFVSDGETETLLSRTWLDVPAGGVTETVLTYVPDGEKTVEFRLETPDGNAADDMRRLKIAARDSIRFLIVETWRQEFTETETAAGSFYLRAAIQSRYADRLTAGQREKVRVETMRDADLSRISLEEFDVVFLLGERWLLEEEADALRKYLENGGAVVRFAAQGDMQRAALWGKVLPCLPGKETVGEVKIAPGEYVHPWLAPFRGHAPTGLEEITVSAFSEATPQDDATVVLALANGRPLAVEKNRVLWVATGAGVEESPLPLTPLYVPLWDGWITGLCADSWNVSENFSPDEIQRKGDVPFAWNGAKIEPDAGLGGEASVSPWKASGWAFLALVCVLLETTLRMIFRKRGVRHE